MNSTNSSEIDYINERRASQRCECHVEVEYLVNENCLCEEKILIHNLSRGGALLSTNGEVKIGDRVDIFFNAPFHDFKRISISGIVVRDKKGINKKFAALLFMNNVYQDKIDAYVKSIRIY